MLGQKNIARVVIMKYILMFLWEKRGRYETRVVFQLNVQLRVDLLFASF